MKGLAGMLWWQHSATLQRLQADPTQPSLSTQFFCMFWSVDFPVSVTQSNISFLGMFGKGAVAKIIGLTRESSGVYTI